MVLDQKVSKTVGLKIAGGDNKASRRLPALNFVSSPTLCWRARIRLAQLRRSQFCCLFVDQRTILGLPARQNNYYLGLFFGLFCIRLFFFVHFQLFRTVLYGTVCTDTNISCNPFSIIDSQIRESSKF